MFKASKGGASKNAGAHRSLTALSPPPMQQQHQQRQNKHEREQLSWGDFLPPGLAPASPSSPLPLFSPCQQSSLAENVLHSIFSPSFLVQQRQQRQNRHNTPTGGGGDTKKRQRHHHVNGSSNATGTTTAAQTTTTTTPNNHQQHNNHERHQRPTSSSIPRSLYLNANHNNLPSPLEIAYSPAQQSSLGWRSGDDDDENDDDFYSASMAAASAAASASSWKTYSLEHITSCHDAVELQQIMNRLKAETTTPCPSLLRAAQERLNTISMTKATTTTTTTTIMPPPPLAPLNEPSNAHNNRDSKERGVHTATNTHSPSAQTATSLSLVYSVDGSELQFPLEQQQQLGTDRRGHDGHNNKQDPSTATSNLVKVRSNCDEHHELQAQVGRLKDTIVELDQQHAQEQADFLKRLQDLRLAESRAGEKIQQLQKHLASSQLSNKELLEALEDMQEDVKTLRLQYQAEQTARTKQAQQHKQVEARLTVRIQQLVQQLDEQQKTLAAAAATKRDVDPVMHQKLAQLNVEVRSLNNQLESVRKERNAMLRAMIDATGQNVNNIKQMAGHDRRCLIADFAKRSAASKSAFDAMAKALTLSETERRQSIDCQRKMGGQIKELVQANARLEENSFQQIQQLSEELAASRAHVDELLHSAHAQQQKDYQEREVVYQRTIRSLKKQICSQSSMVPVRDYKSAIAEATRLTRVVAHLEQEIIHQQEYYHQQQPWHGQQQEMGRVDSQCSSSKENRQPLRAVAAAPMITDNNKNAKQVSIKSPAPPPPPPPPRVETKANDDECTFQSPPPSSCSSSSKQKSKRRQEVVRQHGGRKGLQERIQAVRSPFVATTAVASNKRE